MADKQPSTVGLYSVGVVGKDGHTYAIYLDVGSFDIAERVVEQLGVTTDGRGVGHIVEHGLWSSRSLH